jgi:hypothetical protein
VQEHQHAITVAVERGAGRGVAGDVGGDTGNREGNEGDGAAARGTVAAARRRSKEGSTDLTENIVGKTKRTRRVNL